MCCNYTREKKLRSSTLFVDGIIDGFDRNIGTKTRGNSTAKHPNTIAKTTLGRASKDILYSRVVNI